MLIFAVKLWKLIARCTVDVSGKLNSISTRILKNASAAMAGMAHEYATTFRGKSGDVDEGSSIKRIAITMFGLTTPGVNAAMEHLATIKHPSTGKDLYNPVVFHATGSGGRSMERLIDEGVGCAILLRDSAY